MGHLHHGLPHHPLPWSFETYLFWGSASPLTNAGVHDYVGIFNGYLFIGTVSIVMNRILGPRVGTSLRHPTEGVLHLTTGVRPSSECSSFSSPSPSSCWAPATLSPARAISESP